MTTCEGCKRHQANPHHTSRLWQSKDDGRSEEGDLKTGEWFHVDRSGVPYACTDQTGGLLRCPQCDGTGWIHTDDGKESCPAACDHGLLEWWTCAECSESFNVRDYAPAQIALGEEVRSRPTDEPYWHCEKCFAPELVRRGKRAVYWSLQTLEPLLLLAQQTDLSSKADGAVLKGTTIGAVDSVIELLRSTGLDGPPRKKQSTEQQLPLGLHGRIKGETA